MKLVDKIISNLEFKQKKNNSLVASIEKIKYHDLVSISHIIDTPDFLNQFSHGWNPSHYAVLNSNLEVLYFIANLYQKNNCDLNQPIQRAKKGVTINSTSLDVAISNQKLEQFLILKHFNVSKHHNVSFYIKHNDRHWQTKEYMDLNLPFENSLINLFMFSFHYTGIKLLKKDFEYDEKTQFIKEFLENHLFMVNHYLENPVFSVYSSFFDHLCQVKDNLDINLFDFFAVILLKEFELKKENISYSSINRFNTLYSTDTSQFFNDFSKSQYKEDLIIMFKEIEILMKTENLNKNLKSFFEDYQIGKFLFSLKLNEKLISKNNFFKPVKI